MQRFDVYLVALDPTVGTEIQKTRPCVIISPDEMNRPLHTVIIAPMTSTLRGYPSRIRTHFRKQDGEIALDQLRTVDKNRLIKRWGKVDEPTSHKLCAALVEMFTL